MAGKTQTPGKLRQCSSVPTRKSCVNSLTSQVGRSLRTVASFARSWSAVTASKAVREAVRFVGFIVDGVRRMSSLIHTICCSILLPALRKRLPHIPHLPRVRWPKCCSRSLRQSMAAAHAFSYDRLPSVWVENRSLITLQDLIAVQSVSRRGPAPHPHFR